ncbi:MAG: toxin-antitoxin system YwqK family antitoxin [Candidatus Kapaibacterium sp.]
MKNLIAPFFLLFVVQHLSATTFYDQLCQFNFNWGKYESQAPKGEARYFASDREYVQAHLSSVIPILRSNPVSHLSAEQYECRTHLIEVLDGYREGGKFPLNYYRHERIPVFIDEHNTHCAVGYLLQQTGHEELARRIAATDNYAWVKDIHEKELLEWQEASGFTLEELKLIQGAYDFYMPDALIAPNKYEIPQKPACMVTYFERNGGGNSVVESEENIWCRGEGVNGLLNGRWEQNFAAGLPWIEGYFKDGKRTGEWKEYYQGTTQLCRTENWRDDKLNGVRKRFDRSGVLIEEITFKDGNAITKTNYDRLSSLTWVRKPLDSNLVWTEVYTPGGGLIASGHERVHNPGNLLWFQNIELTALNSTAITARDISQSNGVVTSGFGGTGLYNTPPLVQYKKEGEWVYYNNLYGASASALNIFAQDSPIFLAQSSAQSTLALLQDLRLFDSEEFRSDYDSIRVEYGENVQDFYGEGKEYLHLQVHYQNIIQNIIRFNRSKYGLSSTSSIQIKEVGQYNRDGLKIGEWKHFNTNGELYKTEHFIIPTKEESDVASRELGVETKGT